MDTRYILDTNIASHIIKRDIPLVIERLLRVPLHLISVSVVTQAELLYGVAKRGSPALLSTRVREFLARVDIVPWTTDVAEVYGRLRASCEVAGISLGALDMMIAAQARHMQEEAERVGERSTLVTRDRAFYRIPNHIGLSIVDWTKN